MTRTDKMDEPQRIKSAPVVGIVIDDQSAISLGAGLQQVAEHYDAAPQELVTQAQSGDVEAFEAFYIATAHWLLPRVRLLVTGEDLVEDALVGTYLRAWADIKEFNAPNVKPQEWLLSVATEVIGTARSVAAPRRGVPPVSQVP